MAYWWTLHSLQWGCQNIFLGRRGCLPSSVKSGRQPLILPSWKRLPSPQDPMLRRCNLILSPCVFVFFLSFFSPLPHHPQFNYSSWSSLSTPRQLSSSQWWLLGQATQLAQVSPESLWCFIVSSTCFFPASYFSQVVSYEEGLLFIQTWLQGPNLCSTQKHFI